MYNLADLVISFCLGAASMGPVLYQMGKHRIFGRRLARALRRTLRSLRREPVVVRSLSAADVAASRELYTRRINLRREDIWH